MELINQNFVKEEPIMDDEMNESAVRMFIRSSRRETVDDMSNISKSENGIINSRKKCQKNVFPQHTDTRKAKDTAAQSRPEFPTVMYNKIINNSKEQTNTISSNLYNSNCNVTSVTTKSSVLPPFPVSLVMNHPTCKFMEIRLPLFHSSVDSKSSITHTVIDEHDILQNQPFTFKQPGTELDITVRPTSKTLLQDLKDDLQKTINLQDNRRSNSVERRDSPDSCCPLCQEEHLFKNAPNSIKKDIIFQSQEITDDLKNKMEDFSGVDFYVLPPGQLLIGRASDGDWLISYPKSNDTVEYKGTSCDILEILKKNVHKNDRLLSEKKDTSNSSIEQVEHFSKTNKTEITDKDKPVQKHFIDGRSQHISCKQTCNNDNATLGKIGEVNNENDVELTKKNTVEQLSTFENAVQGEFQNDTATIHEPLCVIQSASSQSLVSILPVPKHPVEQQISVTMATEEPQPVMMMHNDGDSLKVVHVAGNQSQPADSCQLNEHYQNESETESVNIKQEPADTGYDQSNTTELQEDINSAMIVQIPKLRQFGCKDYKQKLKSKILKSAQKRKVNETESPTSSKFILINPVSRQPEIPLDHNTDLPDVKGSGNMLMGDDSDSASGLDDSETSRSGLDSSFGRFPVVNDDERYALMDNESTRGTRKQTRWGVSTFREWLKERKFEPAFEDLPINILDERLEKFYAELRTGDGNLYATNSFRGIRASINRHLRSEPFNRPLSLFTDPAFHKSNKVFKAMMRKITTESVKKERPPPISAQDMHKLMTSNVLSINTPKGLQNKVWLDLTLNFTYKNCPKQRDYRTQMFQFRTDEDGVEYVEINDPNKLPHDISPKMYATRDIYCPVASLMKYLTKRNTTSDDFFQQPRCQKSTTDDNWYTSRPLGERQLSKMMENISKEAGLSRRYTNVGLKEVILKSLYLPVNTGGIISYN